MLPQDILEYVIIHELCHTVHLNHSKEYWALLTERCPNHKTAKKYLKENNYIIKLF